MNHLLLTGATGLLGGYLLAELAEREIPVACLARSTKHAAARDRIDEMLRRFEKIRGYAVRRPIVIEGDLARPNFGIAPAAATWIARNCSSVLHCAASLEFQKNFRSGEPYATNVNATAQLLDFARQIPISHFHYVSTAYVCGTRRGENAPHGDGGKASDAGPPGRDVVRENEPLGTREFGNDYERSKFLAERLVRGAADCFPATIYRPSIIVGDSQTGHTSTFLGFYVLVQAAHALAARYDFEPTVGTSFPEQLGLAGHERKNLVPVDWVAGAIAEIVATPRLHGPAYHLTNPAPTPVSEIDGAIAEALARSSAAARRTDSPAGSVARRRSVADERRFQEAMADYRGYFRDDPVFDSRNLAAALPERRCPTMDRAALVRLAVWAIEAKFGLPRGRIEPPPFDAAEHFRRTWNIDPGFAFRTEADEERRCERRLVLSVTGSGGGEWTIGLPDEGPPVFAPGTDAGVELSVRLRCRTLEDLAAGRMSIDQAAYSGGICFEGRRAPRSVDAERKLFRALNRLFAGDEPRSTPIAANGRSSSAFAATETVS